MGPAQTKLAAMTRPLFARGMGPATMALIALCAIGYVLAWATTGTTAAWLGLRIPNALPWTFVTYPFTGDGNGSGVLFFFLLLAWMAWVGGAMESALGSRKFLGFFLISSALGGLSLWIGGQALGTSLFLDGPHLPVSALTVAWGMRNQTSQISIWGFPVSGKVLAILTFVLVLFTFGTGAPLMGLFACIPLAVAALFALGKLPGLAYERAAVGPSKPTKAQIEKEKAYFDDVRRREKEREEQDRLRKLLGE